MATINPWHIMQYVEEEFCLPTGSLKTKGRVPDVALARAISQYLIRKLTPYSYPRISWYFAYADHTTVLYNCKKVEKMVQLANNPSASAAIVKVLRRIKGVAIDGQHIQNSN